MNRSGGHCLLYIVLGPMTSSVVVSEHMMTDTDHIQSKSSGADHWFFLGDDRLGRMLPGGEKMATIREQPHIILLYLYLQMIRSDMIMKEI